MAGNGRHTKAATDSGHDAIACDWSRALCERNEGNVVQSDARRLPFCDDSFDAALYIAGLHGIPDEVGRQQSLAEVHRVLRRGGKLLVTVWSRAAARFGAIPAGEDDIVVPWRRDGHDGPRTYHLYTPASLQSCLEEAGFVVEACIDGAIDGPSPDNVVAYAHR